MKLIHSGTDWCINVLSLLHHLDSSKANSSQNFLKLSKSNTNVYAQDAIWLQYAAYVD